MAQVSYGTVTITDTTDIERIYIVYAKSSSNTVTPSVVASAWTESISTAPGTGDYIWQRTVVQKTGINTPTYSDPVCVTGPEGDNGRGIKSIENKYGVSADWSTQPTNWYDDVPAYNSTNTKYWIRTKVYYDDNTSSDYIYNKDYATTDAIAQSVEALDKANEAESIAQQTIEDAWGALSQAAAAQYATEALDAKLKYFFWPGDSNYPGVYAASGIDGTTFKTNSISTYGYNVVLKPASIGIGYNNIKAILLDGSNPSLKFYAPSKTTQASNPTMELTSSALYFNKVGTANKMIELTNSALNFYGTSTSTPDAQLTSKGLVLQEGGIEAGSITAGDKGYIYLSTKDYPLKDGTAEPGLTINGHTPTKAGTDGRVVDDPAWREVIGTKFGVDAEGTLYAAGAAITGDITATSLTIGSGGSTYDGVAALNITGYDLDIIITDGIVEDPDTQVYLVPILYHNGEDITRTVDDYTKFVWYRNDAEIGILGSAIDGGVIAFKDSRYKVTYEFDDGAVEGGTTTTTIKVEPTEYITDINNAGIKIHPKEWISNSNYLQIDGNGVYIKDSSDALLSKFTADILQLGKDTQGKIVISSGNDQTYNNAGTYIVNTNGIPVAKFGDTVIIGLNDGSQSYLYENYHSLQMIDKEGNTYFHVSDLRSSNGRASIQEFFKGDGSTTTFSVQLLPYSDSTCSVSDNGSITTFIRSGHQFTLSTAPNPHNIVRIKYETTSSSAKALTFGTRGDITSDILPSSVGPYSIALGRKVNAVGFISTAIGDATDALGFASLAEGHLTVASGTYAHAEGSVTVASSDSCHAEGWNTRAYKPHSHSQNEGTIADAYSQTVLGTYNVQDTTGGTTTHPNKNHYYGKHAVIVGNGTSDSNRSNALTISWSGGVQLALDTNAASGVDYEITQALINLGWYDPNDASVGGIVV